MQIYFIKAIGVPNPELFGETREQTIEEIFDLYLLLFEVVGDLPKADPPEMRGFELRIDKEGKSLINIWIDCLKSERDPLECLADSLDLETSEVQVVEQNAEALFGDKASIGDKAGILILAHQDSNSIVNTVNDLLQ